MISSEMTTAEVITVGAISLLVVKEAFAMVRATRQRNGTSRVEPASVSPKDAPEFYLMQKDLEAAVNDIKRKVDEIHKQIVENRRRD